jgi:hypothetical protein
MRRQRKEGVVMTDFVFFLKREQQIYYSDSFQTMSYFPYGKSTAVPVEAWADPEGTRRISSQISRQLTHEDGKVVSRTHRPSLPPRNIPGTHFC